MSGAIYVARSKDNEWAITPHSMPKKEQIMSEFLYLYRHPVNSPYAADSAYQLQERLAKWTAWFKDLEAKHHIKSPGHPLVSTGAVVKDTRGTVPDGPYAESKDIIGGYSLIEAKDLAQAAELARGCPILEGGGVVEVRPIRQM
jgi:hypothetical protein